MTWRNLPTNGRWTAARISVLYAVLAGLWVYVSDQLLGLLHIQAYSYAGLHTYKGLLFVGITAPLLYGLLSSVMKARPVQKSGDITPAIPDPEVGVSTNMASLWRGIRTPVVIFLSLAAAIGAMGYFIYAYQKKALQTDKQAELIAIADTKVRQIAAWIDEQRSDAKALGNDPFLAQAILRCQRDSAGGPTASPGNQLLLERLKNLKVAHDYHTVALLNTTGQAPLCASEFPADPYLTELVQGMSQHDEITVFDLHRDAPGQPIEMTLLAPLRSGTPRDTRTIGIIYLGIDPQLYLFPLLQSWPLPSRSAETVLVRVEGQEVVYLNEVRHGQGTALNLRQPLNAPKSPAAIAARGQEKIVEGVDYRGVPVLAATRIVPGTSWFLVAKVDIAEIYAPIQKIALLSAVLVGLFMVSAGAGVFLWWRQQYVLFLAEHYRNVTERKALVRHFDYLARYANDIVLLTDEQGQIIEANDRALAAYGFSHEEMQQRNIRGLHEPSHLDLIDAQLALIESSGGLVYETEHLHRDGSPFSAEVSARAMRIEGQRFFQLIIRDISERKQLVRHTEQQARTLDAILSATPDPVWMQDRTGRYLYGNAAALRATKLPQGDSILGKTWTELGFPAAQMESFMAQLQQVFATGRRSTHEITVTDDKGPRHIEYTCSPVPGEASDLYAVVTTARDITERVLAEQSLRESELRFRTFMDNNPAFAFIKDSQGQYLYGNRAWTRQFGRLPGQLFGKTDHDLYPATTAAEFQESDRVVRTRGEIVERLESGHLPDGQLRWWTVIKFPLPGPAGQRLIGGLAMDVTERRQTEEQIKQRQAELTHMNRVSTLGEMASSMAHELNQPLTAITNYCDAALSMLHSVATLPNEKLIYALERAHGQALRAGEIVRHLRDFVRKDTSGRIRLDLNALVLETLEFIALEARFQGVTIRSTLAESLPQVVADRIQLQQVLVNLMHNAIEAMGQAASPVRRLTIDTAWATEQRIQVTVQDTGPGLAPEIAERLFQRFQTTKISGIGLGLSISHSIIEAHGGRLWVEPPSPGQGATFHFTLPLNGAE